MAFCPGLECPCAGKCALRTAATCARLAPRQLWVPPFWPNLSVDWSKPSRLQFNLHEFSTPPLPFPLTCCSDGMDLELPGLQGPGYDYQRATLNLQHSRLLHPIFSNPSFFSCVDSTLVWGQLFFALDFTSLFASPCLLAIASSFSVTTRHQACSLSCLFSCRSRPVQFHV